MKYNILHLFSGIAFLFINVGCTVIEPTRYYGIFANEQPILIKWLVN